MRKHTNFCSKMAILAHCFCDMKRLFLFFAVAAATISCNSDSTGESKVKSPYADMQALTAAQAKEYTAFLQSEWKDSVKAASAQALKNKAIVRGLYTMKFDYKTFGTAPESGRSLYISLHGGGGTAPEANDQQWENQLRLYQPAEGIYLCPRAITNTWDLHFRPESDAFYEDIIHMAVAHLGVNPSKVYLMGYSAGGDGVWRLAPRMADHWAASSMMAGHPGDVSLESLRNLPFMIWCGALDDAYNRNAECAARISQMDALQEADPAGYIHEGHIVEGKGHWMDLVDAAAVPWMAAHTRNPYPDKVVWKQGDEPKTNFYWLGVPKAEAAKGKSVVATYSGNMVEILSCDYSSLTIYLNDGMMDLDCPVWVKYGDANLYVGPVKRQPATMRSTLNTRGDLDYIFPVAITVNL